MKIIVNDVAASKGGALRILKDFYQYINQDKECRKHQWVFLVSGDYLETTENISVYKLEYVKKSWLHRICFDFWGLATITKKEKADYVLSFQNIIGRNIKVPQGVYIHQSIPFQTLKKFSFLKKEERIYAVYQYIIGKLIKASARKAKSVIVQTQWMKENVAKLSNCSTEKIIVAYPEFTKIMQVDTQVDEEIINKDTKFFYPAFEAVYKNQAIIDKACSILTNKGYSNYRVELTVNKKYKSNQISSIGEITYEEVQKKYKESILIFPSYIETIGLPLIEAAQHNTIILAADCPYAHETLQNYPNAYFFNPFAAEELAMLMQQVLDKKIHIRKYNYHSVSKEGWSAIIEKILCGGNNVYKRI